MELHGSPGHGQATREKDRKMTSFKPKDLQTPGGRRGLLPRPKCYFVSLCPGVSLGYRRLADVAGAPRAGAWTLRKADGKGGGCPKGFAVADDVVQANGNEILTYKQAVAKALAFAGGTTAQDDPPITVAMAILDYTKSLIERGRRPYNATRLWRLDKDGNPIPGLVPAWLADRQVGALTIKELERWRESLGYKHKGTLNRTIKPLKKALNRAAARDHRITNTHVWSGAESGLPLIPKADGVRRVFLEPAQVNALIDAAYAYEADRGFGLFVETGAETGARPSQLWKLKVSSLNGNRVMMPPSKKGPDGKDLPPVAVPITPVLAAKLREAAGRRSPSEPLLLRDERFEQREWVSDNGAWIDPFNAIVAKVREQMELPADVTYYALRHSTAKRQIRAGIDLVTIAQRLETSVATLQKHYAAAISEIAGDDTVGLLERPALRVVA
jgi:integrase